MFKKVSIFALALGAFSGSMALGVTAVSAQTCCTLTYDHRYEDEGNTFVISSLTERINAMELAIIEAMRLGTGQLSGNMREQIGADSNIANAQDDRNVVGLIEQARLEAIRDAATPATACNVITGSVSGTSMQAGANDFAREFSKNMTNWNLGTGGMPSEQGADVAIASMNRLHCERYANEQDVASGFCDVVGEYANASVDPAQSLFFRHDNTVSATLPADRVEAAEAYLINLINPRPIGPNFSGDISTPAGQEAAARRNADTARVSMAAMVSGDVLARRTVQAGSDYASYMEATGSSIPGYSGDFSEGVSWHDFMDIRARGWYMQPSWTTGLSGRGSSEAIKDIALIQSYQAYLGWETYKLLENQNMILSTMLAIQIEEAR